MRCGRVAAQLARPRLGFTLVEVLTVVGIVGLLLAILLPAFKSVRDEAKSFVCMNNVRSIGFDFRIFADPYAYENRGDSEQFFPRFKAVDFLESVYQVDEFWEGDPRFDAEIPYKPGQSPVLCSAVPHRLVRENRDLESGLIEVGADWMISYAMNRRLRYAPVMFNGLKREWAVTIGERIFDHPNVPLVFDIHPNAVPEMLRQDGRDDWPFFSTPPGRSPSIYDEAEKYWFPSFRHRGRMSIALVGGGVVSTSNPLDDASLDWDYHPPLRP